MKEIELKKYIAAELGQFKFSLDDEFIADAEFVGATIALKLIAEWIEKNKGPDRFCDDCPATIDLSDLLDYLKVEK